MISFLGVLISLLFANSTAHAGPSFAAAFPDDLKFEMRDEQGGKSIWVTFQGNSEKVCDTIILPKGTRFFHWTNPEVHAKMVAEGKYGASEFEEVYEESTHGGQSMGPGLYVSLSPVDSSAYGERVLMFEAPEDLLLAKYSEIYTKKVGGFKLDVFKREVTKRLRAIGIDGAIKGQDATWISIINVKAVQNIKDPTASELFAVLERKKEYMTGWFNPINVAQILFAKGYGERVPNDWTRKYEPLWDKILRGQPLSSDEEAQVPARLKESAFTSFPGPFSQDDPYFQNLIRFFESRSDQNDIYKAISNKLKNSDFSLKLSPWTGSTRKKSTAIGCVAEHLL